MEASDYEKATYFRLIFSRFLERILSEFFSSASPRRRYTLHPTDEAINATNLGLLDGQELENRYFR